MGNKPPQPPPPRTPPPQKTPPPPQPQPQQPTQQQQLRQKSKDDIYVDKKTGDAIFKKGSPGT
jgi:hypothetical protein